MKKLTKINVERRWDISIGGLTQEGAIEESEKDETNKGEKEETS